MIIPINNLQNIPEQSSSDHNSRNSQKVDLLNNEHINLKAIKAILRSSNEVNDVKVVEKLSQNETLEKLKSNMTLLKVFTVLCNPLRCVVYCVVLYIALLRNPLFVVTHFYRKLRYRQRLISIEYHFVNIYIYLYSEFLQR